LRHLVLLQCVLSATNEMPELVGDPRLVCPETSDHEKWQVVVSEVYDCVIEVRHHLITGLQLVQWCPINILQSQQYLAIGVLAT